MLARWAGWDGMRVNGEWEGKGREKRMDRSERKYALLNNNQMTNNPIMLPSV